MPTRAEVDILINALITPSVPGDRITSAEHRQANKDILDYVDQQDVAAQLSAQDGIISGSVTWTGTGFIYDLTNFKYKIGGVLFTPADSQVTLNPADATNGRIDLFIGTNAGTFGKITGTPAATPIKPQVNAATQIELSFAIVPAGAVSAGSAFLMVYDENTESTGTSDVISANFAYATNPAHGAVSTRIPAFVAGKYLQYVTAAPFNYSPFSHLKFKLRLTTAWDATKFLTIRLKNGATFLTSALNITEFAGYGFDPTVFGSYQSIVIPLSDLIFYSDSLPFADTVHITMNGNSVDGFQLDWLYLVGGTDTLSSQPVLSFKGRNGHVTPASGDYTPAQIGSNAFYETQGDFPATGEDGVIYTVTTGGDIGKQYYWNGAIYVQTAAGGDVAPVVRVEWFVGGPVNVTGTAAAVTGTAAGSTTISSTAFAGSRVNVIRGYQPMPGINPGDGSVYFTKVTASNDIVLNIALQAGEYLKIETIST